MCFDSHHVPDHDVVVIREFPHHLHRLAIVVDVPKTTAISMLLAKENEDRSKQTGVFSTVESAVKWLGRDPEQVGAEALGLN